MGILRKRREIVGSRPGTLVIPDGAPPPRARLIDYTASDLEESDVTDVEMLREVLDRPSVTWVDIQGLGDMTLLQKIGEIFSLHDLLLEEVVNVPARPKAELFDEHFLFITRMLRPAEPPGIEREQLSIVLGKNYVLTFQERYGDVLDPVRRRIRLGQGPIRRSGADYLAYAILDAVIDGYVPVLEELGEYLETLEDEVLASASPGNLRELNEVKRSLLILRRLVWPQRDALNRLIRDGTRLIAPKNRIYFRDIHDNCIQAAEITEAFREMAASLVNTYLSSASNRMNETMKILTIMASVFIPLTFIAGIYGMNFDHMPELHSRWSYPAVLLIMVVMAAGMLRYFRRRGWLATKRDGEER